MDRLSRDIRNDLSEALVTVLADKSLEPAEKVAALYLEEALPPIYTHYIDDRLKCYAKALQTIAAGGADPLWQGLVLWDLRLFFEVHEILEHAWLNAQGEEKKFLQSMIRAAGVYIKLEHGYGAAAQKIAAKALPVLEANRQRLAIYTTPEKLTAALHDLSIEPPLLLRG